MDDYTNTLEPARIKQWSFCDGLVFDCEFESGNIAGVRRLTSDTYELSLRDDNDNPRLPSTFRGWWYFKAQGIPASGVVLRISRLGFKNFVLPVYSLDGQTWQHFPEAWASMVDDTTIEVRLGKPPASTLWMARTFPYTVQDYLAYRASISGSPHVQRRELGKSPFLDQPIDLLTITDQADSCSKKTVWIQARTHAAEVGSSYLLEGFINYLLSDDRQAQELRTHYVFKIVPMQNPDGVILGNYRTNASSQNLEPHWYFSKEPGESVPLQACAPAENKIINAGAMADVVRDTQHPVVLALNLHSSNEPLNTPAFFFPHFGPGDSYSDTEKALWHKQIAFVQSVASHYEGRIESPPADGGRGFMKSFYPETWYWYNTQDKVNAITLETTYGKAGFDHWVTPVQWRALGKAVALAIHEMGEPCMRHSHDRSMFCLQATLTRERLQAMESERCRTGEGE
ncbi:Zinc carboxypeptidase [compost metagenome]